MSKVRTAWLLMRVTDIRDISMTLSHLIGDIQDSNFLKKREGFNMPVITKPMRDIQPGDIVRLSYFVKEEELKAVQERKAFGFADTGMRYEVLRGDGWDLLHEDHDPHFK